MTITPDKSQYAVQIPIRDWLVIDATMDNHIQSAIEGGSDDDAIDAGDLIPMPAVARLGMSIRQAGWDQIPGWPHDAEGFKTWPAPGQTTTLTLTGAQWDLVISALLHWAAVDEDMDDAGGAAESRAIATAVKARLVGQGWS